MKKFTTAILITILGVSAIFAESNPFKSVWRDTGRYEIVALVDRTKAKEEVKEYTRELEYNDMDGAAIADLRDCTEEELFEEFREAILNESDLEEYDQSVLLKFLAFARKYDIVTLFDWETNEIMTTVQKADKNYYFAVAVLEN